MRQLTPEHTPSLILVLSLENIGQGAVHVITALPLSHRDYQVVCSRTDPVVESLGCRFASIRHP